MAKTRRGIIPKKTFDAFFNVAGDEIRQEPAVPASPDSPVGPAPADDSAAADASAAPRENLDGKFLVFDSEVADGDEPFVLVPAHIYAYVPWWGWTAIGLGLLVLAAGVVFMPVWSLDRLASRLGDANPATAQRAMRSLVMNGDERTVRKLYDMASSGNEGLTARLRAIDTMSLISGVPEVDRSLLRLELAGGTNEQIREAAIAARKQREASRTRGNPPQ